MNKGMLSAFLAYFLWGISIIYWKSFGDIDSNFILAFRIIFSFIFLSFLLLYQKKRWIIPYIKKNPKKLLVLLISGLLLSCNWITFVWGINNGHIFDVSLGYFINPIVSIIFGIIFLREKARSFQILAIAIIFIGVGYITFKVGSLPYISLILAFSFALYGLIKKQTDLGTVEELFFECSFLFIPALIYLFIANGNNYSFDFSIKQIILILLSGVFTATPLLLFSYGAKRIKLIYVGILQFFAPTIQFLLGIFLYHEMLDHTKFTGFIFVWIALSIYIIENIVFSIKTKSQRNI